MELSIVGSGTASPHPEKAGASFHLAVHDVRLLLDCGPSAVHHLARFGLPWHALTHLAISHFHASPGRMLSTGRPGG